MIRAGCTCWSGWPVRTDRLVPRHHPRLLAQIFALARAGYLPPFLAAVHPRFKTPHRAILAGGVVGIAAIFDERSRSAA